MTDLVKSDWKELDSDNTNPSPNGVQGGYAPSTIGPIIRSLRGALKRFYVQSNALYATTGTGAAYVLTYAAAPQGYSAGIIYRFYSHADNTGAATLNINSLGAKAILSQHGEPLTAGKIKAGKIIEVAYNGTSFELISNEVHDSKFTGTTTLANFSASGNASIANLTVSGLTSLSALGVSGNTSITNLTVSGVTSLSALGVSGSLTLGPGTGAVDGTIIANLNTDRPWTVRQRGADATASLSFENVANRTIGFSSEATYSGPNIVLDPSATPSITIGGNPVYHADNDGAGSGLDADTVDGIQASSLVQTSRTVTAGNGLTGGGALSGNITLTIGAPGSVTGSSTNSVTATSHTHELALASADVTGALGYTPTNSGISVIAGNGLSGGGTLAASRTLTLGTPGDITNATTNSVTATSHTHALGFTAAEVYTGSTVGATALPVGHPVMVAVTTAFDRNQASGLNLHNADATYYVNSAHANAGTALAGTWRARGFAISQRQLFQRTA